MYKKIIKIRLMNSQAISEGLTQISLFFFCWFVFPQEHSCMQTTRRKITSLRLPMLIRSRERESQRSDQNSTQLEQQKRYVTS